MTKLDIKNLIVSTKVAMTRGEMPMHEGARRVNALRRKLEGAE